MHQLAVEAELTAHSVIRFPALCAQAAGNEDRRSLRETLKVFRPAIEGFTGDECSFRLLPSVLVRPPAICRYGEDRTTAVWTVVNGGLADEPPQYYAGI